MSHAMAFGTSILADKLDDFITAANRALQHVTFESKQEVDVIVTPQNTHHYYNTLLQFAENDFIYGNGIPQPKVVVEMNYNQQNSRTMGKKGNSSRFSCGSLVCVLFQNDEVAETISNSFNGKINMLGRVQLNEFRGSRSPQIIVEDYDIVAGTIKQLF